MKLLPVVLASLILLAGSLAAGEERWTDWKTLDGERKAERVGNVQYRTRRDPQRDSQKKGYFFEYQLRMASDSHVARVKLYFPKQDPQDPSQWEEPNTNQPPTVVHEISPENKAASGSRYSPSPTELEYKADITWQDELTPVTDKDKKDPANEEDPGETKAEPEKPQQKTTGAEATEPGKTNAITRIEVDGSTTGYTSSTVPSVVLHIPLDSKIIAEQLGHVHFGVMEAGVFRGTITVKRPKEWDRVKEENQGMWAKDKVEALEIDLRYGGLTSLTILSRSNTEIRYSFAGSNCVNLLAMLSNLDKWGTTPEEIVLTDLKVEEEEGNGPATQQEEKVILASTSELKSAPTVTGNGAKAKVTKPHEGYWYDPTDAEHGATDPMIYVRYHNQAVRVRLSVAKNEYGVPKSATPATMSNYNEQLHMLITKDRTTHLRP